MNKKKLFLSTFFISLSAISLPLFVSCGTSDNQQSNNVNNSSNDNKDSKSNDNRKNPDTDQNLDIDEEEKTVPDVIQQVGTKYSINKYSNKLFFRGIISKFNTDLTNNDIKKVQQFLFPNGNWTSTKKWSATIYEAENFNSADLFKKFLNYDVLKNQNSTTNSETVLSSTDMYFDSIENSNNLKGTLEIQETKDVDKTQREISLVVELLNNKTWKSNSKNYSIIFTYIHTHFFVNG